MDYIMNQISIKLVNGNNAEELAALAKNIYSHYYDYLWNEGGKQWYMHDFAYNVDTIRKELCDKNNLHYIAYQNDEDVAYIKIKINATLKGYEELNAMELERIYIYPKAAGKGLGKQLIQLTYQTAKQHHKELIFLKAMDTAKHAIAFYQSFGFEICGTFTLSAPPFDLMKEEYRGMVIMKKMLQND
jgi:GNAT superfamily N-acetyltransferase